MTDLKDVKIKKKGMILLDRSHLVICLGTALLVASFSIAISIAYFSKAGNSLKLQLLQKLECRPTEIKMSNINRDGAVVVCFPEGSKKAPRSPRVPKARRRM